MALRSVRSRSLADEVFDQLAAELMAERYAAGAALPSERDLVETFGVARHVVREAIKRLEQIGLVKTMRGGATRVLDFKQSAGLDLLALLAEHARGGEEILRYSRSVLEMRVALGVDIVRLCAERASDEVREALVSIAAAMAEAGTDDELFALEVRFWDELLRGADNIAYRLAVNSLLKGVETMGEAARALYVAEIRATGYRMPIAEAITARDPERARDEARDALQRSLQLATG